MKIFTSGRGEGKTNRVIREAVLNNASILVSSEQQVNLVKESADKLGLCVSVVSYEDLKENESKNRDRYRSSKKFYIDNLEILLEKVLDIPVAGFTINSEIGTIECVGITQPSILNAHTANSLLAIENNDLKNDYKSLQEKADRYFENEILLSGKIATLEFNSYMLQQQVESVQEENARLKESFTLWKWLRGKLPKKRCLRGQI